jgi:hypothetical protein
MAFRALLRYAFALWVIPGHVIILRKPSTVTVTDGKLIDVSWEDK